MKIEKLIIKNFNAIRCAMDTDYFEIDLTKSMNNICMIIGPNGSGKTTILSYLTPFADVGNLDVRNKLPLIEKGKDGYKEIQYSCDGHLYIIKHFYTPHKDKSHSVKSYIEKDGVELNVNGNVSSFKEYVKEELGIEPDYLKLMRLGSNVTSLISLSETERKTFMGKMLDEIGVFLERYKAVNLKLRQLKEMISHSVNKLNRLGVVNKKELLKQIEDMEKELDNEQNAFGDLSGDLSVIMHEIDKIENKDELVVTLRESNKKLSKMEKIMERKDSLQSTDVSFYDREISRLEKEMVHIDAVKEGNVSMIQNHIQLIDKYFEQLRSFELQYQKEEEKDKEYRNLQKQYQELDNIIKGEEHHFNAYEPSYTKNDIEDFIVFLKMTQEKLNKIYEFGNDPINKVLDLMKEERNVLNYVNKNLMSLSADSSTDVFLTTLAKRFQFKEEMKFPCGDDVSCEAKTLWRQVQNLIRDREPDKERKDIDFYNAMESVYYVIKDVLLSFKAYKTLIPQLPKHLQSQFLLDNVTASIRKGDNIYAVNKMNDFLSYVMEYESYKENIARKDELKVNMDKLEKMLNTGNLLKYINDTRESIDTVKEEVETLRTDNFKLTTTYENDKHTVEDYKEIKETLEKYDIIVEENTKMKEDYDNLVKYTNSLNDVRKYVEESKGKIDYYNRQIRTLQTTLVEYTKGKKELSKFNKIYDEMDMTKKSLSSKDGMPLWYIKDYLGETVDITNELLDIAYDGRIYLNRFKISPDEFSIPFVNKGREMEDVKYASQGEISFLSLALSFALSSQTIAKYNICLWDEIDAALDTTNRGKFISIVENQIERVKSEQNFLISHNDMFSSYPVDIIDLSFKENTHYPLANYVTIKKKES